MTAMPTDYDSGGFELSRRIADQRRRDRLERHRYQYRNDGTRRSGRSAVPWHVPEGAEFDREDTRGYRPNNDVRRFMLYSENPWHGTVPERWVHQLEPWELRLADPHPDELEDWDLGPYRAPLRPVSGVFDDYASLLIPDDEIQDLIDEADRLFDLKDREVVKRHATGPAPIKQPRRKRITKRRSRPNPAPVRETVETALPDLDEVLEGIATPPVAPVPDYEAGYAPGGTDQPICRECGGDIDDADLGYCDPCADVLTAPRLTLDVEPEPEPDRMPESDYAAAMRRVWGAP